jgi:23S rRNA (uracil1939-C5)-methyltransferase
VNSTLITIDKLAFGGAGFGLLDGKACFVPFTAPDELARIKLIREKRSYCEGELLEVVRPSLGRVSPRCPVFASCGGCFWQHLDYPTQLEQKEQIFAEALWRGARVERQRIETLAAATEPFNYRSRIQLKLYHDGEHLHIGFFRQGSHYVVDLPGCCAIAAQPLNAVFAEFSQILRFCPEPNKIPQIDLATGSDSQVTAMIHYIGRDTDRVAEWLRTQRDGLATVAGLYLKHDRNSPPRPVFGVSSLSYQVPAGNGSDLCLSFQAGGFAQVNYRQNRLLVETAMEWSALSGTERVLDLYCGNGNFSLPLARHAGWVTGLENCQSSIDDACQNALENQISNTTFTCTDTARGVQRLVAAREHYDLVLLDPPRTGAADVLTWITALHPERIIYVSCDPTTLARDLNQFSKHGYQVQKSRPVDMFPQTFHIESITLLTRPAAVR